LGIPAHVIQQSGNLRVEVERPSPPVDLLTLMHKYQVPAQGALTAVLGLDDLGQPVQLDLARVGHVLIVGGPGSGKTSLLRTILASLMVGHSPDQLQIFTIGKFYLPGRWQLQSSAGVELLNSLTNRMDSLPVAQSGPHAVLVVDSLESVLAAGFTALKSLLQLMEVDGRFTLLVSTARPEGEVAQLCSGRWGTRLVGQVENVMQAEAATGVQQSQAEKLPGDGAFFLVQKGRLPRYFQAAFADDYDISFLARNTIKGDQDVNLFTIKSDRRQPVSRTSGLQRR
jgi:S-DNA-T family DNA segregation ATPase FtsK/SpoIIIE